jgi:hypothetical protein
MQNKNNTLKKIILFAILVVIILGIFFGITFYQASKKTTKVGTTNSNPTRTPFQTRVSTSSDVVIVPDTEKTPTEVKNPVYEPQQTTNKVPKLTQLWKEPVSGFDFIPKDIEFFSTSTETNTPSKKTVLKNQTYIYFWDRSTGNVYENLASTTDVVRLSNYTSPKAESVYFTGPTTILTRELAQDNENIITSKIDLYKESATSTLFTATKKRVLLNTDLISISKDTKKMFYVLKGAGQAFVSNIDLSSTLKVLDTKITQWIPQYVNKTTLALTTKPSAYFQGYLFFINSTGTQDNQYILGNMYGFTTLVSPDGSKILYSQIENDLLETSIYDIKSKKTTRLTQATLTEKCVWSSDSKKIYCAIPQQLALAPYPDVWYQGSTTFSDNIWSIDPNTGSFDIEVALQDQVTEKIDAYNLKVSDDSKYLIFQDKYTLTFWKYIL